MRSPFAAAAIGFALTICAPAFAQRADLCPDGQEMALVRISNITETGSRAGFDEAVKDHTQWYRDNGYTENAQVALDVFEPVRGGAPVKSASKVMTIHYNPPGVPREKQDAGWAAFVAKYRANSKIETEEMVCIPAR